MNRDKLNSVIEDLTMKTREEILTEKKEREGNEDLLLSMLENTCEKIQNLVG